MTYLYPYRRGTGWRSQGFRSRPNQGSNGPGGHTGFDQAMESGQPLYAPADGIIRNSGWLSDNYQDNGWWLTRMGGDTLVIDCTNAFQRSDTLPTFIFAHCSDTMAAVGQRVRKGELVALSGNTGTATTGPHVHIEALPPQWDFNNGVYGRVDPESYFDEWVDDYAGGLAAMGGTITPQQEDELSFTDDIIHDKDGGKTTPEKLYNSLDTKITRAEQKLDLLLATVGSAVKFIAIDGSTVTLAEQLRSLDNKAERVRAENAAMRAALQEIRSRSDITPEVIAAIDKSLSNLSVTLTAGGK